MKSLVSIVIPTYNRAVDLKRALLSVLNQTYTNWEVIIVDNHSTDNTNELVNEFADQRIKLVKINNNGLIAASRNLGIKSARGEYVAFLDSDDWWTPNKLDESIQYLENDIDFIYHDMFLVKKPNQMFYFRRAKTREIISPSFRDLLLNGNAINNSSVIVRKRLLDVAGMLPEDIEMNPICDYHAWLHISKHTEKIKRIPKVLGYYWVGGGNVSTSSRTITSLTRFESIYERELKIYGGTSTYMCNYIRGRTLYMMKSYEKAKISLSKINRTNSPISFYIKARLMLFMMKKYIEKK